MAPNTEDETTSPSVGGPNPSSATVDQPASNNSNNNSTTTVIAAGATAGICAMVLTLAIGMYLVRKKKRESSYRSKGGGSTTQDLTPDRVGLEIETHSETLYQQQQQQPSQSYFGTIHKKEGEVDDISTLGDPYMGDAVVNRMDADNTVGERYVVFDVYHLHPLSPRWPCIPFVSYLLLFHCTLLTAWYQTSNNYTSTVLANQEPISARQVEWVNPPYSLVAR